MMQPWQCSFWNIFLEKKSENSIPSKVQWKPHQGKQHTHAHHTWAQLQNWVNRKTDCHFSLIKTLQPSFFSLKNKTFTHYIHIEHSVDVPSTPPRNWLPVHTPASSWWVSERTLKHHLISEAHQPQSLDCLGQFNKKLFLHEMLVCTTNLSHAAIQFSLVLHGDTKSTIT